MKAQQLKNAILQLAIQGKLVPQDPNDEPASVLLEKIQAEKAKLIAEGKIKKSRKTSDKLPSPQESDFPFDIPESWVWVKLEEISEINPKNQLDDVKEVSFIPMKLIDDGYNNSHSFETRLWKDIKKGFTHFSDNDIAIAKITPCFENRKSVIFNNLLNGYGAGTTELFIVRLYKNLIENKFIFWFIKSQHFIENGIKSFSGTAGQQRVSSEYIKNCLIPLPPLNEQKRIVAKLEELLPFIDEYDKKEEKLTTLNQQFPEQLKKSILQSAIQGKLVEQDPNDEPASELIKRIQAEKERLILEKKIKKPKVKSEIVVRDNLPYEIVNGVERCIADELPFEIPESWCWVRLGNITNILMGSSPIGESLNEYGNGIEFHQGKGFFTKKIVGRSNKYTTSAVTLSNNKDLLLSVRAPVGEININNRLLCIGRGLAAITPLKDIESNFLFYWLISFKLDFIKKSTGSTFKAISSDVVTNQLIPFPPLNEQKRIVQKIEELFSHIKYLK